MCNYGAERLFSLVEGHFFVFTVDCQWSDWESCDVSCGGGKQSRNINQQTFNGGKNCTGAEIQDCNMDSCPIPDVSYTAAISSKEYFIKTVTILPLPLWL